MGKDVVWEERRGQERGEVGRGGSWRGDGEGMGGVVVVGAAMASTRSPTAPTTTAPPTMHRNYIVGGVVVVGAVGDRVDAMAAEAGIQHPQGPPGSSTMVVFAHIGDVMYIQAVWTLSRFVALLHQGKRGGKSSWEAFCFAFLGGSVDLPL